ncbi:MAG TPA: alpha/beta fold hydrolase [Gemmatimonadales bacterium]|nr:alpha/beta fold hydrolase [Gemmatimonadales bacterium]
MKFFRAVFNILQPVWPAGAAWLAERLFFTAPRSRRSTSGRVALAGARRFTLSLEGRRVVGWRWGEPDAPVVYLVHGWASRGSRLAGFTAPLLAAGYGVVTFDAPGHGDSGRGMSSIPEFARTLRAVVARAGEDATPHAVIAHSLGCAATTLALSWGLEVERLAFLAPPADPPTWAHPFARALGIRPEIIERFRARSERRIRFRWADLNVCDIARRLPAHAPLLIVHDRGDETISWNDGVAIAAAWPGARFVTTNGLGHRGVTHDEDVLRRVLDFVIGENSPGDASSRLEHELFYREDRP